MIEKKIHVFSLLGIVIMVSTGAAFIISLTCGNDFWVDEAMLVQTVFTRGLMDIASTPPDYSQNAPLAYLGAVKCFSLIFGNTTTAVRMPAVLAAFGVMFFAYRIAKDVIGSKIPLLYAGLSVLSHVVFDYATQVKQYSLEAMCCLVVVWLLGIYWQGKIKPITLAVLFAVILWFSFTSNLFILSGIMVVLIDCLSRQFKKVGSFSETVQVGLPFVITLISALINIVVWVLPCSAALGKIEHAYWDKIRFPLVPVSFDDIKLLYKIARHMMSPFGEAGVCALILALAYVLLIFDRRKSPKVLIHKNMIGIYAAFFIGLVASYFKFLPMTGRVWIFAYPLVLIGIAWTCENLPDLFQQKSMRVFAMIAVCLVLTADFAYMARRKPYIRYGQQLSRSVEYVEKHKTEGDKLYIASSATPQYSFLTHYENKFDNGLDDRNVMIGNIIYGARIQDSSTPAPYEYDPKGIPDHLNNDVLTIAQYDCVWLLFAHGVPDKKTDNVEWQLLEMLMQYGAVTLEHEYYDTPLYLFKRKCGKS